MFLSSPLTKDILLVLVLVPSFINQQGPLFFIRSHLSRGSISLSSDRLWEGNPSCCPEFITRRLRFPVGEWQWHVPDM